MILAAILVAYAVYNFAEGETAAGIVLVAIALSAFASGWAFLTGRGRIDNFQADLVDERFETFHR